MSVPPPELRAAARPIGADEALALRESVTASRGVVKSQIRSLRTTLSFLADLDERLGAAIDTAQPQEAQRDDDDHRTRS